MSNIEIIKGAFDTQLELKDASVVAGFPSPADDYSHETLDFNRDYIRHPEATFYGKITGLSMRDAGLLPGKEQLLYIGRSGEKKNGVIVHRKCGLGGIKDRLVNGHQFGKLPRRRIWPEKMREMGLSVLSIDWYDTEEDDPVEVERLLLAEATYKNGVLPPWNNQLY